MKRFLKFYQKDKQYIKMINATEKSFELIIINSDKIFKELLEVINTCEEKGDEISIVWQMKHKPFNFIVYKNCIFSAPMDNFLPSSTDTYGKKIKVTCSGTSFYSDSYLYKNQKIKKSNDKYKDAFLLTRMLKLSELNVKSEKYE